MSPSMDSTSSPSSSGPSGAKGARPPGGRLSWGAGLLRPASASSSRRSTMGDRAVSMEMADAASAASAATDARNGRRHEFFSPS